MKTEKVSIVTPCYNGEKYLERFLKSILNQSYGNIELIFINDGSTDQTEEIIKKYKVNPTDMSILSDYTKMASKAADWSARADEIELELKDTQEALEYSAELLRIAAKLAEAAY